MAKPMNQTCLMAEARCEMANHKFWKEDADKVCADEENISGKIVIVTGANGGIGKQATMQLAKRGAVVIMAVRNVQKGQEALDEIKTKLGESANLQLMKIDMSVSQSIRDFVKEFTSKYDHLNILVNNAGYSDPNPNRELTKDGFEQHIGINHLGPFLLTKLLLPSLQNSGPFARIVCVSSSMMATTDYAMEDILENKFRKGNMGFDQYSVSKLVGSICMSKLASTLETTYPNVKLTQMCPGVVKTDLVHPEGFVVKVAASVTHLLFGISLHKGCETVVFCAVSRSVIEAENSGRGEFYRFTKIWEKGYKYLMEQVAHEEDTDKLYKWTESAVGL